MKLPRVLTVSDPHERLHVGSRALPLGLAMRAVRYNLRILWDCQGLYGMIPPEILADRLDTYDACKKQQIAQQRVMLNEAGTSVHWGQTVPVPSQVARLLLGDPKMQLETVYKQPLAPGDERS